mmetsp:Transcript_19092/g.30272  ORF Transcript_19092/g.30272 Transcript_19092/m.30272 type:complete len:234 (-) Transcript_19092:67-768(-)|eukprot:CAMPEP_0197030456 /NCGR_PEP_ID=MMETSP1384-20130603/9689_1 /TAXON_ID=29189 /ORGANISM="Ammonia sp." /LENGTH=233 /DNA_ID=CAMNT_0042459807 /DNA_START=27 /DNA_END=728 /DNA_ORIENTATION=+
MAQAKEEQKETAHTKESSNSLKPRQLHERFNSSLGTQQLDQLKVAFNLFDKDHNGRIDLNELQTVLKTLGQNMSKEETEEMMSSVDINDDGEIDYEEFVQMMENRMFLPSNTMEYQDAFKFFDKNGDGFIDFTELKDVLLSLGEEFTEQDIQDMVDEADTTGNGKVDFDEFIKMMPSNMQENFVKCKQRDDGINGSKAKSKANDKNKDDTSFETEPDAEDSDSVVPTQVPTKR